MGAWDEVGYTALVGNRVRCECGVRRELGVVRLQGDRQRDGAGSHYRGVRWMVVPVFHV